MSIQVSLLKEKNNKYIICKRAGATHSIYFNENRLDVMYHSSSVYEFKAAKETPEHLIGKTVNVYGSTPTKKNAGGNIYHNTYEPIFIPTPLFIQNKDRVNAENWLRLRKN
jgi:hypothetical protein